MEYTFPCQVLDEDTKIRGEIIMLPKKIYLNYVDEDDEYKTWSEDPVYVEDCEMQNREYTDFSQVWHNSKEEPEKGKLMICIGEDGVSIDKWVYQYDCDWLYFAKSNGLIGWAYVDDLLPKGDKK